MAYNIDTAILAAFPNGCPDILTVTRLMQEAYDAGYNAGYDSGENTAYDRIAMESAGEDI